MPLSKELHANSFLETEMDLSSSIMSDIVTFDKYARHLPALSRRETWDEIVTRVEDMHIKKFPFLEDEIRRNFLYVRRKDVLASMRSMQFAGKPAEINNARIFNCCYLPIDHPDAFSEAMFLLLSGTGVGYSVQRQHIEKLPVITRPHKTRRYLVGDSIEGWADAVKVLISSYMRGKALPVFDFSDIRPKGALLVTSGGKAPGPEPLKNCLHHIQMILDRKQTGEQLRPIEVHDILCHIADAVLSGGIRRSAMICLFDLDDDEMITCKFGAWYETNPQRGRANNSAVILRHKIEKSVFMDLFKKIELSQSGEPGFMFTNDSQWGLNPCAEISLRPFQFCNLCEINASTIRDQADFNERARVAAFIGTLQASYTDFHYLRDVWKRTTEREALIGTGMTGIASGAVLNLDMEAAAKIVLEENERVAKLIGINKAARATTVKPSGTTSLVLGTSSGIHAWHNDYYIRRMKLMKTQSLYTYLSIHHPELLEDDLLSPRQSAFVAIPQRAPAGAITRQEPALDLLERVKKVWQGWVKPGHRKGENKNNVSVSVSLKPEEWQEAGEWIWDNRDNFTAISCFPYDGGSYVQAPYEDCTKERYEEMVKHLHKIDLTNVIEVEDATNLSGEAACAGGACEIV
jgi:ribonucleoside-triphosphate reductase